ncbi:hypothetical protein RND81_08G113500 [Saponaria officinalis]|uniref:RING-type E3 ubiquitin transferase n=1 Tax=Saponaria officinalis TaxID=3572 RepID=A0AAW1J5D7_SAPOF
MGGCCCCWFSSRRSEPARTPTYYYCPRTSEERQPLSANHGVPSGTSGGLLVDTNLDTSDPDTYTSPPAPLPYDSDLGHPLTPRGNKDIHGSKSGTVSEIEHSSSAEGNASPSGNLEMSTKDTDSKADSILELTPSYILEDDLKKPVDTFVPVIEEDDCPICLEEYTEENPKLLTKCEHHFHLCCILEWMERSEACPVCDQEVVIDEVLMGT